MYDIILKGINNEIIKGGMVRSTHRNFKIYVLGIEDTFLSNISDIADGFLRQEIELESANKITIGLRILMLSETLTNQQPIFWTHCFNDVSGVIFVINSDNRQQFDFVPVWFKILGTLLDYFIPFLIIFNQKQNHSQISKDEVVRKAKRYEIPCICVESLTAKRLIRIYPTMSRLCLENTRLRSFRPELW